MHFSNNAQRRENRMVMETSHPSSNQMYGGGHQPEIWRQLGILMEMGLGMELRQGIVTIRLVKSIEMGC